LHPNLPPFITEAFYDHGEVVQRGSRGRTPDQYKLDLGLKFIQPLSWRDGRLQVSLDVFNVFNGDTVTELNEYSQQQGGASNQDYLLPQGFQRPRFVRISARVDF
jgi:hypothetical protein